MPDGIVQWFDQDAGEGRVLHRRRRYAIQTGDIETDARVPGARVHFDIDHAADGTRATNVSLRRGTRSDKPQRRFGDLTGASTSNAKKPPTSVHQHLTPDQDVHRNPVLLAERWAEQLAIGDLDEVLVMYSPTATLHTGGQVCVGVDEIRRHWHASSLLGGPQPVSVGGTDDGAIVVRWPAVQRDGEDVTETRLQISRAEITEQWLGTVTTPGDEAAATDEGPSVEVSVDGQVGQRHRGRALERIGKVLATLEEPVLHARIRLVHIPDAGRDRPVIARVMLDVNGEHVRASVATDDLDGAIDALESRLRQQLHHMASHREALHRRGPQSPPGEWRHGDLPAERPDHYPRPVEERQVVRHKTFAPDDATVDEAVFDMESMDYDFYLFTDLGAGQEACIHRREGGTYGLQLQEGTAEELTAPAAAAIDADPEPAPRFTLQQAREYLDVGPDGWVFFTDADSGRGRVLYRRYDGHYGLIMPR